MRQCRRQRGDGSTRRRNPRHHPESARRRSLIIIGHDGRDVHPLVRELGVCVHKEGLKEATFYEDVRNRKGVNPIFSVSGIPETDCAPDDKEPSPPSRASGCPSSVWSVIVVIIVIVCQLVFWICRTANSKVGDFVPYSAEWVRQRWNEYQDDGKHRNVVGEVTDLTA